MQKPTFEIKVLKELDNYGQFAIEPLENGFGHTLGNALRRVLLSSFRGAAIVEVKIAGVTHKFSTLEGMSEDMIDIMLNLKSVKVGYEGKEPVTAKLSVKGPATVTAADITVPAGVTIANPDMVIAKLAKGGKLEMELTVMTGFGYSPSETRSSDILGTLSLDANFSPVERVSYKVEATRVGRRTDFDKLVMDIYTDGSQSPLTVLKESSQILAEYFTQVYDPKFVAAEPSENKSTSGNIVSLEELDLPTRVLNALKNADYNTANELTDATDKDLKNVKNLGSKSVELVDEALTAKGLTRTQ